ncbi:hypothetical protein [Clostridium folliculivorans]|uniref:Uncharacterized protein n=1 Tax=Clostridium folliculivorans TaxID=2886038 RepID=A0A9W6D9V6_9CLOT|nr:hypothetical protein [Clostridium folliculivorans]GKU24539.1 hypothetical protein CFOLD11_13650 [Clostridium folliculivorans]GKU30637.1 hypothetical protein CFB3_27440 [Clostridium folliculivorans]
MEQNQDEVKELLKQLLAEVKDVKERVAAIEKNQIQVANAEHKNWHMLAEKLEVYDKVLYKVFGKKSLD